MPSGTEGDLLVTEGNGANYNTSSPTSQMSTVRLSNIVETNQNLDHGQQGKLSTFFGVIVPCCLSMFSVILFLRMGFIVGQAGLLESVAMTVLAYSIIGFTVLSICAISTNGAVEGGGAYFMISRALGPEFGGAIGLMFFLANAASSALYIFGIVEALVSFFGKNGQLLPEGVEIFPSNFGWNYLYGTVILLICFLICVIGADIYAKATFLIFVVVIVSIASVVVSFFAKPAFVVSNSTLPKVSLCNVSSVTYTGFNHTTLQNNIYPDFTVDYTTNIQQNFILVFAVLFNGCTGIMAGANMSGDLKNPSRSIPIGTISACAITFFTYQLIIILISATTPRVLLHCDFSFLLRVNLWGPFVAIGVFASSLSAALSCLIGASRILFALARDDLFGIILRPMTKTTRSGNPIIAVLATWFLVQLTLFAGKINTIAPIVTTFFLFSYAATDLACLALEWASAPNFRPTFKLFSWHTCLLGFLSCVVMMFLVSPIYASVGIVVLIVLVIIIHYRVPTSSWGYISQALIFHQVRKYMLMLDIRKEHVKFWRPQVLLMVKNPRTSCQLINFINSIKKSGLFVLGHVKIGHLSDMTTDVLSVDYPHWLNLVDMLGVKAFVELTLCGSVREGTEHLLRISGLGGMKPNTIVLGFHDDAPGRDTFKDTGLLRDQRKRSGSKITAALQEAISPPQEEVNDNNLESFFRAPGHEFGSDRESGLTKNEYVAIIRDALKLRKNVCLARYFNQLDKSTVLADKGTVYYIDVWPVNFLRPLLEPEDTTSPPSGSGSFNQSTSYFDTTCVFLMQMACILNMTPFWKKRTKLRIFLCVEPGNDSFIAPGDQELEDFLKTVRINAEIKQVTWSDIPQHDPVSSAEFTIQNPSKQASGCYDNSENLHASNSQTINSLKKDKPSYLNQINSLIRSQRTSTAVTFLYLPAPPYGFDSDEYVDMLTKISQDLGPTFFVHGLSHVISTTL